MKKSIIFLINGLGIERPGSYSISIDQCMPNLTRIKETSFFTSAITDSIDVEDAYQRFFLGDTYRSEIDYINKYVMNQSLKLNKTYLSLKNASSSSDKKLHIFLEPTNDKIVDLVNQFVQLLDYDDKKRIFLHLILSQQNLKDYTRINSIINTIKYHIDSRITVGFVFGREFFQEPLNKQQMDYAKQMFFSCTCERWRETDKKISLLENDKIRPCDAVGFCSTNTCYIENGDTILFFNTRRQNYDVIIKGIDENGKILFGNNCNLSYYSFICLHSSYNIPYIVDNIDYENSLSNVLLRNHKKMLIITDDQYINMVNFYANGLNSINNPIISFMRKTNDLYQKEYLEKLINETVYDLIIFDYHMDTSSTINHLKDELTKLDGILANIASITENNHSLFITSLYGLRKRMPVADYNPEIVTINYEAQIPIFFFDYYYPRSKYDLFPGETNDILESALKCITDDPKLDSLIREKSFVGSLIKSFIK